MTEKVRTNQLPCVTCTDMCSEVIELYKMSTAFEEEGIPTSLIHFTCKKDKATYEAVVKYKKGEA